MYHRLAGEPRLSSRLSGTDLGRIRKDDFVLSRARLTLAMPRRGPRCQSGTNYAVPGFSLGTGSPSSLSQWFPGRFLKGVDCGSLLDAL